MANFNAFDAYEPARQAAYDSLGQQRKDRGRMQAGRALQSGDYAGAQGALYGAGDLQGGMQVQQAQEHSQDRQLEQAQQQRQMRQQEMERHVGFLKAAAASLRQVPAAQRAQAYAEHVGPALQEMGMDPQAVQAAAQHLDDASLDAFAGDLDKHLQGVNLGGGGYGVFNQRTGEFVTKREPTQKAPAGYTYGPDGGLVIDPGYVAGQGQVADVRAAGVAAHRPPPRGRSGGGGAGKPKPWERKF